MVKVSSGVSYLIKTQFWSRGLACPLQIMTNCVRSCLKFVTFPFDKSNYTTVRHILFYDILV